MLSSTRTNYQHRIVLCGMFTAFSMILSYIDSLIPIMPSIPGIKLGLANFIIIFLFAKGWYCEAVVINVARVVLSGLLFGSLYSFLYSLNGAFLSMLMMFLAHRLLHVSVWAYSMAGGMMHNIGQLVIAFAVFRSVSVFYYLPYLTISGALTGIVLGIMYRICDKYMKPVWNRYKGD